MRSDRVFKQFINIWRQEWLLTRAGSLTFSSILAVVPLMVVSITLLHFSPVNAALQQSVQNFIFSHFVASSSQVIQSYLAFFAARAWQLSGWSIAFLAMNALGILFSLEHSLNAIWQVKSRTLYKAVALYLVILVLSPLLMSLSIGLSLVLSHSEWLPSVLLPLAHLAWLWPMLISFLSYALIFKIMPHAFVPYRAAMVGAGAAALLFEWAKHVFAWYVVAFPSYERLYGAVAAVPLFFLWLYFCWLILLCGAVVAYLWQQKVRV